MSAIGEWLILFLLGMIVGILLARSK